MRKIMMSLLLMISTYTFAQLNCKLSHNEKMEQVTTCFHKNDSLSTIETWDKDKRFGTIKGFDNKGKQLFQYYLRKIGGSASTSISYYPNGQVSRVDFSDNPDGGIQFYNSTRKFDTLGKQISYSEMQYPLEHTFIETNPKPPTTKSETVECAVPFFDYYEIKNTTKSKVFLHIKTKSNPNYTPKEYYLTLKPNKAILYDSLVSASFHPKENIYEISIISYNRKRKQKILQVGSAINEEKTKKKKTWIMLLF